jgi:hypothetical protein
MSYLVLTGAGIEEHSLSQDGRFCVRPVESIEVRCQRCKWTSRAVKNSGHPHPEQCVCGGRLLAVIEKKTRGGAR